MYFEALIAAALVALVSLVGVLFFGSKQLVGEQKYVIPVAVGVFLSLVLYELIPETIAMSPTYGGIVVAIGFISFYILAALLHKRFHHLEAEDCDRKGAAALLLVGDTVHNMADGIILGGAFLVDPAIGVATAIGLALHEVPQEIVEFGVLVRAGYSRTRAAMLNLVSASSIFFGTALVLVLADVSEQYIWILTGLAAGNLLFLAASDLLPRIHGDLKRYGSVWNSALMITIGFVVMTLVITWTHEQFGHGVHDDHAHESGVESNEHDDHDDHDDHEEHDEIHAGEDDHDH